MRIIIYKFVIALLMCLGGIAVTGAVVSVGVVLALELVAVGCRVSDREKTLLFAVIYTF